ncbi:MAG TPA: hypothetical protein VGM82_18845 [Gemmatimonadaceae bacterium]|jgi:hypothetical protein
MFYRWAAPVLVLALCAISPKNAAGQTAQQPPREHGAKGKIVGNYPNPFNPDTYVRFTVGADSCAPGSSQHVVTVQVVNVLAQGVAVPVLHSATSPSLTLPDDQKLHALKEMKLSCGAYVAYWDGKLPTGHLAAAGVYGVLLVVDGSQQDSFKIYFKK